MQEQKREIKKRSNAIHQQAEQALNFYLIYQTGADKIILQENKAVLQIEADYWMAIYLKLTRRKRSIFKELGF